MAVLRNGSFQLWAAAWWPCVGTEQWVPGVQPLPSRCLRCLATACPGAGQWHPRHRRATGAGGCASEPSGVRLVRLVTGCPFESNSSVMLQKTCDGSCKGKKKVKLRIGKSAVAYSTWESNTLSPASSFLGVPSPMAKSIAAGWMRNRLRQEVHFHTSVFPAMYHLHSAITLLCGGSQYLTTVN